MNEIRWDIAKNEQLLFTRGASFEELINKGKLIAVKRHHKRKNQNIILFEYKDYVWVVPYVKEKDGSLFLKTLYPSRKYTKMYKGEKL